MIKRKKTAFEFCILSAVILFLFLNSRSSISDSIFPDDYSTEILDSNNRILRIFLNRKEQWHLIPDSKIDIPDKLEQSVITFEDKRFFSHNGVDGIAILRAIISNIINRRYISGASTITMQTARLSANRKRTLYSKVIESLQAFKIEKKFDKKKILKLYLNHAPYGGNIIGYRTACLRYWGKYPDELTWAEAATLAVLPNNPSMINPVRKNDLLKNKRDRLLKTLLDRGYIDEENYELSLLEEVPHGQIPFDLSAPHLCRDLNSRYQGKQVKTTIDKNLQDKITDIVQRYSLLQQKIGINNAAALVIETKSGKVRAYVGSQDFFDTAYNGSVDGVRSLRSYGSVLKPFLYALSFDEKIIIPESLMKDIPTYYGSFSPFNADMKFSGVVRAKNALIRSLNVPAVRLLYTFGQYKFYLFLEEAGLSNLFRNPDDYGLTIILGGAEASLWDIAKLYRGIGNMGDFSGIYVLEQDSLKKENRLISQGASYLTLDILRDVNRPEIEYYWNRFSNQYPIAWKTGTSYGFRDAWACGVTPEWTIVVWLGNFTGKGNPSLGGASTAGPLLFEIFNALKKNGEWFEKPELYLEPVTICSKTGYCATDICPETSISYMPRNYRSLIPCPYHKTLFLNNAATEQVCSQCWQHGDIKEVVKLVYPPEVIQYLKILGQPFFSVPPHRKDCPTIGSFNPIDLVYPTNGSTLFLPKGISGQFEKIVMRAAHSNYQSEIYWYIDGVFIGSTIDNNSANRHTIALSMAEGKHSLTIVDDSGYKKSIEFNILVSE